MHLAFSLNNHTVGYIKYDGSRWSQPLLLAANNNEWPTISSDGLNIWVFWEQDWGIGYNRIVHRRLVGNGQWDRTATTSWAHGFERPFDAVWTFQQRTGTYTDERRRATETAPSMALPFLVEPGDMLYLGQSEKFSYVLFGLSQAAGADPQPAWEYWNGSAWVPLTLISNAEYRFLSATPEQVQFAVPEDWQMTEVNGYQAYYIRVRRQSTGDLVPPVATQILPVRNMHSPLAYSGPNGTIDLIWTESAGGAFPQRIWYGSTSMHPIELPSPAQPPHDHGPVPLPPDVPPLTPTPSVTPTSTPTPGVSPTATATPVPSPTAAPTPTPTPVPLPTSQPTITSFNGRKVYPAPPGTLPVTVELRSGESTQFTLLDGSPRTVTLRGTRLVHAESGVTVYATATVEVSGPGLQPQQAEIPAAYFHSPAILNDVRVFVDITKEFNDPGLIDGGGTTADARLLLSDARFTMSDISKYRWPVPSLLWWEGGYHAHWQGLGGDPGRLWHHRGFDMGMPPNTPVHAWAAGTLQMSDRGWDRTVQLQNAEDGRPFFEHSVFHFDRVEPAVVGQPVQPGDLIGYSGRANWYHIHFANVFQWEPLLAEWYMAHATPVQLSYIREWLALGPFFHNDDILRLTMPYIENEAFVEPKPGDISGGMTWRLWDNIVPGVVHVAETIDPYPNSGWAWVNGNYLNHAAYLATYIHSSEARSAVLRIGASDAVRVWLNNEAVLLLDNCLPNDYPMSSGSIVPDDVAVNINLRAGWNRLLIKTAQKSHFGDCWKPWQLSVRISDAQGNPIPDLVVSALKQIPGTPAPTPQPPATPQPTPGTGPVALTRHPYLQNSSQTTMTVVWRTDVAGEGCVDYGPTPA